MSELTLKEWCESRGFLWRDCQKISTQLQSQYVWINKALKGVPVPTQFLEQELLQLVHDVQNDRFPVRQTAARRKRTSVQVE